MASSHTSWVRKFAWKPTKVENLNGSKAVVFLKYYVVETSNHGGSTRVRKLRINK